MEHMARGGYAVLQRKSENEGLERKGGAFRLSLMSPVGSKPRPERWSRPRLEKGNQRITGNSYASAKPWKKTALKKKRKTIVS